MKKEVAEVFDAYPAETRANLERLRALIFETAAETEGVGEIEETLKWGQPSYLTTKSKSGTAVRIDRVKGEKADYAMYVHCQTSLVNTYRMMVGDAFRYEGTRAILFDNGSELPVDALKQCIVMALRYHLDK